MSTQLQNNVRMREQGKEAEELISQHRSNPQINHRCALCKQLNTAAVAKKLKTVYSNSPLLLTACQSTILPLSVSQAVASCQTTAVVCHATVLPHTMSRAGCHSHSAMWTVKLAPHNMYNEKRQRASGAVDVQEGGRHLQPTQSVTFMF